MQQLTIAIPFEKADELVSRVFSFISSIDSTANVLDKRFYNGRHVMSLPQNFRKNN
jgi:hypothetical protein